ncbi:MAG: hypothetical protein Q7R85_02105 [bacterium]|nr:hypothetical protein [bacterium]
MVDRRKVRESFDDTLNRISRNIARMATPDQIPRTVFVSMGPGCGCTLKTVYPPDWEFGPGENPQDRPAEEEDERSPGAPHNID